MKPVAYAMFRDGEYYDAIHPDEQAKTVGEYNIPLYTHPVKEMSETRIKQIFVEQTGFYFDDNPADDLALMDFAKALLLEAQEK